MESFIFEICDYIKKKKKKKNWIIFRVKYTQI